MLSAWLGLSAALAGAADEAAEELPPIPEVALEEVPCPFPAPPGERPVCLLAELPMDHGEVRADGSLAPDARTVRVHLTLLPNLSSSADPNPIVVLSGGPGQAGSDALDSFGGAVELRRNRGILLVDQRGTGLSEPALTCPEAAETELDRNRFNDPDFDPEEDLLERVSACHDRWIAEGVDLARFGTRSAALDLRAIRRALDLSEWNLLGTSYGARLALDLLRVDPVGVRAAVLNSPLVLAPATTPELLAERPRIFAQLFEECAADPDCAEAHGDLEDKFREIAEHFREETVQLHFRDPQSGQRVRREVGWPDVVENLYGQLAFSPSAVQVPRRIAELHALTEGRLSLADEEITALFTSNLEDLSAGLALGQHLSVKCREDLPRDEPAALQAVVDEHPLYFPKGDGMKDYRRICPGWEAGEAPARFLRPATTDRPVLILSGAADTLVPHAVARRLAERIPHSQFVAFPGIGHDVHGTLLCAQSIAAHFFDHPHQPVDTSCTENFPPRLP